MKAVPEISIVICTYNRCRYLPQALESIAGQAVPNVLFELIVVDNASTDDTAVIVQNFISKHPLLNARYVYEANKGLSSARNRGWKEAASDIVAYVDDDVILFENYIAELHSFFTSHPNAQGAGGRVIPKYEDKEPDWMSKYLKGFVGEVFYGDAIRKFDATMKYPAGANMIYRRYLLEHTGGFNDELKFRSDDKYIFYKVREHTDEIYYLPEVALYHYIDAARLDPENFKRLFLKTGNEEKIRLLSGRKGILGKGLEYSLKVIAGAGLYVLFFLKGQASKGHRVWLSQWYTFLGFLKKDVFVR